MKSPAKTCHSLLVVTAACSIVASTGFAQSGSRGSGSRGPVYSAPRSQPAYRAPAPSSTSRQPGSDTRTNVKQIALQGYSPVAVTDQQQWQRGNPQIQTTFDGMTYYFATAAERQQFLAAPEKYVPALGGDCTVCYAKSKARIAGSVANAATSGGRVYLFPSAAEKSEFLAHPERYVDADLAFDGQCAVCFANSGQRVAGRPEYAAVYQGLRYLFPSQAERTEFLTQPNVYAAAAMRAAPAAGSSSRLPAGSSTRSPSGSGSR